MSNALIRQISRAAVLSMLALGVSIAQPSKEYIRLGGRVIAIESSSSPAGNSATYVGVDMVTKGDWMGQHGQQGHRLAKLNAPADMVIPSGVGITLPAIFEYEWGVSTVSSLLRPTGGGRITSVWFTDHSLTYNVDLNLSGDRQVSFYFYDPEGVRAQTVEILDGTTLAPLCSPGCYRQLTQAEVAGGIYVTWTLRGHVKLRITRTASGNPILNGIFFDTGSAASIGIAGGTQSPVPVSAGGSATYPITLTRSNYVGAVDVACPTPPVGVTCNPLNIGAGASTGTLTVNTTAQTPVSSAHTLALSASGAGPNATGSVNLNVSSPAGNSATYVGVDMVTKGDWMGQHGQQGHRLAKLNAPADMVIPSGVGITLPAIFEYEWGVSTVSSLLRPTGGGRIASVWFTDHSLTYNVDLNLSGDRQVSFYFYDPEGVRAQTVEILDGTTLAPLCSPGCYRQLTQAEVAGGIYVTWTLRGHVKLRITRTASGNPILNAIFFDSTGGSTPALSLSAGAQSPAPVVRGNSATFPISITRTNFSGSVSFSCVSPVTGVTCSAPASTSNATTLTVNTTASTPVSAAHTLTLSTTGAGVPSAGFTISNLTVSAPGGSITLSSPSTPARTQAGRFTTTSFSIASTGFTGPVTISCSAPVSVSCSPVTVNAVPGANPVTLQVNVAAGVSLGSYTLTIGASGPGVSAVPVTATLTVVSCALQNINSTQLPINGGATITLQLECNPGPNPSSIVWETLNSALQPTGNNGSTAATAFANRRVYTAPPNSGTTLETYYVRATDTSPDGLTATFAVPVNPPLALYISPQGAPPYVLNPGGHLILGVQVLGAANTGHTCSLSDTGQGTLTQIALPGYSAGWRFDAPATTNMQVNQVVTCVSTVNAIARDSFPVLINPSASVPPSVTSLTWSGNGSTTSFQLLSIQASHAAPGIPPQAVSMLISPASESFSFANACRIVANTIAYGSGTTTASWQLWNDAGTAITYDSNQYSYYLYPNYLTVYYYYNSQCDAHRPSPGNAGMASIAYGGNTIYVNHGLRYRATPSFLGLHAVWGQVTVTSGLQSAWTAPLAAPTKLTVQ